MGEGLYCKFEPNETDLEMLDKMTTLYSNFAKFGWDIENSEPLLCVFSNPNGYESFGWEAFSLGKPMRHYRIAWPESGMKDNWQGGRTELVQLVIQNGKKYSEIAIGKWIRWIKVRSLFVNWFRASRQYSSVFRRGATDSLAAMHS